MADMSATTILLSRAQFGITIGFHILFPTLTLGLSWFLVIMEAQWLRTDNTLYLQICRFWDKIFALTFGMGVVSGVVLAYELGTNFGPFIHKIGPILGPLFAYEVLTAFFLEAGFLGVMLFGWNHVSKRSHFFATVMVALGTNISALWIMGANSWMQTPAGYEIIDGIYNAKSWIDAIFNPSFLLRFTHMLLAAYVTTTFVVAGVSAWHLLRQQHIDFSKKCLKFALLSGLILVPVQIGLGDMVGLKMFHYQPLKTAAIEGVWETQKGAPLLLFAIPDTQKEMNHYEVGIPKLASWFNTHDLDGKLIGLKSVSKNQRPIVAPVFYMFRMMVGLGFFFLLISLYGVYLRMRGKLFDSKLLLRACVLAGPLGFLASEAGWIVAESGRQPWLVYGLMKTAEGASLIQLSQVAISLALFILVYIFVFSFYLYYTLRIIAVGPVKHGPDEKEEGPPLFGYMVHDYDDNQPKGA